MTDATDRIPGDARLTEGDQRALAEYRELAAVNGGEALRAHLTARGTMKPSDPEEMLYPLALGVALWLAGDMAAIIGRLTAAQATEAPDG